jgi:hypothetical protein
LADLVHLDARLRLFAQELEPKTIPAKRIGKLIYGLSKENCRAAASTRCGRPGSHQSLTTASAGTSDGPFPPTNRKDRPKNVALRRQSRKNGHDYVFTVS